MTDTATADRAPLALDGVPDLDAVRRWPDGMVGTARDRTRLFAHEHRDDPHGRLYFSLDRPPAEPADAPPQPPSTVELDLASDAGRRQLADLYRRHVVDGPDGPQRVAAARPTPRQATATRASAGNPLAFTTAALDALQAAMDAHEPVRLTAADPDAQFATLTTTDIGAPRAWGANVLRGPRLLHVAAGVPRQGVDAVLAQFPQLTLPTAQAAAAEGGSVTEYASSAAGSVTLGRFGRWTDLTTEALIGGDAQSIMQMHQLGIALDLDAVLINAVESAAGSAVAFAADVPAQIRNAQAAVMAATATDDPADVVILVHPDNAALLQDVTPTGGQTIAERFQRFSGSLVYPSTAVNTGFMTVANMRVGARYFEAAGLRVLTHVDPKTAVETAATFMVGGYGVTLTAGFAVMQDVVA